MAMQLSAVIKFWTTLNTAELTAALKVKKRQS